MRRCRICERSLKTCGCKPKKKKKRRAKRPESADAKPQSKLILTGSVSDQMAWWYNMQLNQSSQDRRQSASSGDEMDYHH